MVKKSWWIPASKKKNIIGFFGDSHTENVNIQNKFQFTTLLNKILRN